MNSYIDVFREWPVIIQGALGSGLFWVCLLILQKVSVFMTHRISMLTASSQASELRTELLKIHMIQAEGPAKLSYAAPLLFRMSRPFLKAMLWLVSGLLLENVISIFGVIGYMGSIYYLVVSISVVSHYEYDGDLSERRLEILKKIKELEGK